jgi:hypothetical protein
MTLIATALLIVTTAALLVSTWWRLRRPIDAALIFPLAWLALIPFQILIFGFLRGYSGAPRDNLYVSVSIGNLTFLGLQQFLGSRPFARLAEWVRGRLAPSQETSPRDWERLASYWWFGLAALAVGLALAHLWLMPRVPLFELLAGANDPYQLQLDRENAAKLLAVPSIVRYFFTWDSSILLPILFVAAVLYRWRYRAIFAGVFGLIYVTAPLDKMPSLLFLFTAFVALAVRDRRRAFSKVLIVGLIVSLLPAYLISESQPISLAIHHAIGAPVAPFSVPSPQSNAPPPGEVPIKSIAGIPLPGPVATLMDLTLRRIGSGPADVMYQWFSYFPSAHPFLNGYGWEPWKVLSPGYQSPANMVGLWAYYGKFGYQLVSLSAYTGFVADGWAEFGYIGVLIACLWLFAFAVVIQLMGAFSDKPFCLACYVPCMLLVAVMAPQGGIMAITFSLGLAWAPLICAGYLLSGRLRLSAARSMPEAEPAQREPSGRTATG